MYGSIRTFSSTSRNFLHPASSFFASVEFLFYLFPLIFPEAQAGTIVILTSVVEGVLTGGLLLYGAHKVSSANNRTDYVYMIVIQQVLILR
jgi:hypothetical protein